jgi:hypothetical protein
VNARRDAGTGLADISYAAFADTDPDPEGQNCANGIYAGYCGTQKSNTGLYIAVGFGGQIIGTKNPLAENAEFFWFADAGSNNGNNDKYAVFAPDGIASNKVMTDINHHIVLATATGGSNQKWVFDGNASPGFWRNPASGDILKATFDGGPIVTASTESSSNPKELWTFKTP